MKLKFINPHKSIVSLSDIEINDFAIITGLNGSGKTHLLKAIEEGAVSIEGIPTSEIVYYNNSDFNIEYDYPSETAKRIDISQLAKKNKNKNGSSIVNRIIEDRTKIINSVDFIQNTTFDNLVEIALVNGIMLSMLDWNDEDVKGYKNLQQIPPESNEYQDAIRNLPEKFSIIRTIYRNFIPNIENFTGDFKNNLAKYFNKLMIRSMKFNFSFLEWTETDVKMYEKLQIKNPNFKIEEYKEKFSKNFFNFLLIYQDKIQPFSDYLDQDLSALKEELLATFELLENAVKKKLNPEHLRIIKHFSVGNSVFSILKTDSGALDLNVIADEEKQYLVNKNKNDYNGYLKRVKKADVIYHTDEEFLELYGCSPVKLLNKALFKYDCNGYEFIADEIPNQYGFDPRMHQISITLYNKIKGYKTDVESLSSGEKILLALTFYIYKLRYKRKVIASVMLLDELDSSLHPSMSKRILSVLYELFYCKLGIKIIISTHSPSTVAFAPDNSLYIMRGEGNERLLASSKDAALKELTFGVPSFSINYENRRQVFVESKYDVQYYERLYQIFKTYLQPEISLNFIASGDVQHDKNGQSTSNCAQVIKITDLLRGSGNKFVWGIIDWDLNTKRPDNEYIRVLGWQQRYSIENFLLDPLLMTILLLLEKIKRPEFYELKEGFKVHEILRLDECRLQRLIWKTLEELKINLESEIEYTSIGGKVLTLPKGFLECQGHQLEEKYLKAFPELNRIKRNCETALKMAVLDKVIEEYSELAPSGLLEIMYEVQKV